MRFPFVFAGACCAAFLLLATASGGTFPGSNGLIAFTCNSGSICTATDGAVYGQPLIQNGTDPVWSPSGARLAFQNGADIYLANADGSGQVLFKSSATEPTWSSDNTTIAFVSTDGHIWARNSSNNSETQLTSGSSVDADPSYNYNGTKLAYSSLANGGSTYHLWVANGDGTNPVQLTSGTDDETNPTTKPESKR